MPTIFLTASGNWPVPSDWNSLNNTVDCIGEGGSGSGVENSGGGSGGCFARSANIALTPGAIIPVIVGAGASGTDTSFNGGQVLAKGGAIATSTTGASPQAGSVGNVLTYLGGSGGNGAGSGRQAEPGGGGGAAGSNGAGIAGTDAVGGARPGNGGAGDNGSGGAGGTSSSPNGSPGTEYNASYGCGGGGFGTGGGGTYGGAAGGFPGSNTAAPGLIVITYTPAVVVSVAGVSGTSTGGQNIAEIDFDASGVVGTSAVAVTGLPEIEFGFSGTFGSSVVGSVSPSVRESLVGIGGFHGITVPAGETEFSIPGAIGQSDVSLLPGPLDPSQRYVAAVPLVSYIARAPSTPYLAQVPFEQYVARIPDNYMPAANQLPSVAPAQVQTVTCDFGFFLPSGVTLTGTPTVTVISDIAGVDPSPSHILSGSPTIGTAPPPLGSNVANAAVLQRIASGLDGAIYLLEVTCSRTDGDVAEGYFRLPCEAPH